MLIYRNTTYLTSKYTRHLYKSRIAFGNIFDWCSILVYVTLHLFVWILTKWRWKCFTLRTHCVTWFRALTFIQRELWRAPRCVYSIYDYQTALPMISLSNIPFNKYFELSLSVPTILSYHYYRWTAIMLNIYATKTITKTLFLSSAITQNISLYMIKQPNNESPITKYSECNWYEVHTSIEQWVSFSRRSGHPYNINPPRHYAYVWVILKMKCNPSSLPVKKWALPSYQLIVSQ